MEKIIERSKGRAKGLAAQIKSTLKGISYKADMAAKNVAKLVKGIVHGQQRRIGCARSAPAPPLSSLRSLPFFRAVTTEAGPRSTDVVATVTAMTAATRCAHRRAHDSISNRPYQAEAATDEDSDNQDEAGRLHQSGPRDRFSPPRPMAGQGHADRQDDRDRQPDEGSSTSSFAANEVHDDADERQHDQDVNGRRSDMEDAESCDPGEEQDDAEPKQHGVPFPTGSAIGSPRTPRLSWGAEARKECRHG